MENGPNVTQKQDRENGKGWQIYFKTYLSFIRHYSNEARTNTILEMDEKTLLKATT